MRIKARTWMTISLLLLAASAWLWHVGDQVQARRRAERAARGAAGTAQANKGTPTVATKGMAAGGQTTAAMKPKRSYRLTNTTETWAQLSRNDRAVLLRNAWIDTARGGKLSIPENLRAHGAPGGYIVQSSQPLNPAFYAELARLGATYVSYFPNNAALVRASPETAQAMAADPAFTSILPYEPYYKLDNSLLPSAVDQTPLTNNALRVAVYPGQGAAARQALTALGGSVMGEDQTPFGPLLVVTVPPDKLVAVAQLPQAMEIESYSMRHPLNDLTREQLGVATNSLTTNDYLGLTGTNIPVVVVDTGVDQTHPDFAPSLTRLTALNSNALTDPDGHGTFVAGIIAGGGNASATVTNTVPGSLAGANFRGMAPQASLFAQQAGLVSGQSVYLPTSLSAQLPVQVNLVNGPLISDYYLQTNASYSVSAKHLGVTNGIIANNSWGYNDTAYDMAAASYDAAVRDAQPGTPGEQAMTYVFAAGDLSQGLGTGFDGTQDSITSPGTAKNVITVSAIDHPRFITSTVDFPNAGLTGVSVFTNNTDSSNLLASFSSAGNVGVGVEGPGGRFKPDVVAPGVFIVSARATNYADPTNQQLVAYNTLPGQNLPPGVINGYSITIPPGATNLLIQIQPNASSPVPFPNNLQIWFDTNYPPQSNALTLVTLSNSASVAMVPYPAGTNDFIGIYNPAAQSFPVAYDISTYIIETNQYGSNYYSTLSTLNSNLLPNYRFDSGTSSAAAAVSGVLALMQEFLVNNMRITPSPALLKGLLINGSRPLGGSYDFATQPLGPNFEGWGLPYLPNSLPGSLTNGAPSMVFYDQNPSNAVTTGQWHTYQVSTTDSNAVNMPLRITLVWTDPPGNPAAGIALVNDLDLVVADITGSNVYVGNDFPSGDIFTAVSDASAPDASDNVNNVENVYIDTSFAPLAPPYTVSVRGKRVSVNAVTGQTTNIMQDYALVISSDDPSPSSALTVTDMGVSNTPPTVFDIVSLQTNTPQVTLMSNGAPLFHERVGGNEPGFYDYAAGATNGELSQWHFFIFTNDVTYRTNTYTNVVFATFLPPSLTFPNAGPANLSVPAANNADIDLYVSTDQGLLTLQPTAVANASKSLGRGGNEVVAFSYGSNNLPTGPVTYYAGVKSETQQGADFAFLALVATNLGNFLGDGPATFPGFPLPAPLNDALTGEEGIDVFAFVLATRDVRKVQPLLGIQHPNPADTYGTFYDSGGQQDVLNHYSGAEGGFTNAYDDVPDGTMVTNLVTSQVLQPIPSDGPGTLRSFVGQPASGMWRLNEKDNALTQTGLVTTFSLTIWPQPQNPGNFIATIAPNGWYYGYYDVPDDATNLSIQAGFGAGGPVGIYLTNQDSVNINDYGTNGITTPGGVLDLNVNPAFNLPFPGAPPLSGGRWYYGITNESGAALTVHVVITNGINVVPNLTLTLANTTPIPLQTGAHTDSQICVDTGILTNSQQLVSLNVGLRVSDTNLDDLVIRLLSPQGASVLLFEDRGGTNATDLGLGSAPGNYLYTTFTENSNLASQLIKFAPPPFAHPLGIVSLVDSSFEVQVGDYGVPTTLLPFNLSSEVEGWDVATNDVSVVAGSGLYPAYDGSNYLALANGQITRTVPTIIGQSYAMTYAYRPPGLVDWWPMDNANVAEDIIGTNNGTFVPGKLTNVYAVAGQGYQFNGNDSQINFGTSAANFGTNDFTIDCWFSTTNTQSSEAFLAKRNTCSGAGSFLSIRIGNPPNPGIVEIELDDGTPAGFAGLNSSNGFSDGQWHHAAWVRRSSSSSNSTLQIYVDGMLDGTVTYPYITFVSNSIPLIMGQNVCQSVDGTVPYSGAADELDIWNRALSDAEIAAIYEAGTNHVGKATPVSILPNCQFLVDGNTNTTLIAPSASSTNWLTNALYFTAVNSNTTISVQGNPLGMLFDDFVLQGPTNLNYVMPEESLGAFTGQNPSGCWTLDVWDTRTDSPLPTNGVLLGWNMQMTISSTNADLIVLTNQVPYASGSVAGNSIAYFGFDVPIGANFATNLLTNISAGANLSLLFNQTALPTGTGLGDYELITNAPGVYTLTNNAPPPSLLCGERYFLGVVNNTSTNATFTIEAATDQLAAPASLIALTNLVAFTNSILPSANTAASTTNAFATNAPQYYSFLVPTNAVLASFTILDPTNEMDLYAAHTLPVPSSSIFDYETSYDGTNSEAIVVSTNSPYSTNSLPLPLTPGNWYLAVYDYSPQNTNAVTYRIVASYITLAEISNSIIALTNAVPYTNTQPVPPGPALTNFYSFTITNSPTNVLFTVSNMTANVDLLARDGALPTPQQMTAGSFNPGTQTERITLVTNTALPSLNGVWYLAVPNDTQTTNITYVVCATTVGVTATNNFPAVVFASFSVSSPSQGFTLSWHSVPNGHYEVDLTTNLFNWTGVTNVTTSGGTGSYTDPTPIDTQAARFYRVFRTQ